MSVRACEYLCKRIAIGSLLVIVIDRADAARWPGRPPQLPRTQARSTRCCVVAHGAWSDARCSASRYSLRVHDALERAGAGVPAACVLAYSAGTRIPLVSARAPPRSSSAPPSSPYTPRRRTPPPSDSLSGPTRSLAARTRPAYIPRALDRVRLRAPHACPPRAVRPRKNAQKAAHCMRRWRSPRSARRPREGPARRCCMPRRA